MFWLRNKKIKFSLRTLNLSPEELTLKLTLVTENINTFFDTTISTDLFRLTGLPITDEVYINAF